MAPVSLRQHRAQHVLGLLFTVAPRALLPPLGPTPSLLPWTYLRVWSWERKKPSGSLALKDPTMRPSRQCADPTCRCTVSRQVVGLHLPFVAGAQQQAHISCCTGRRAQCWAAAAAGAAAEERCPPTFATVQSWVARSMCAMTPDAPLSARAYMKASAAVLSMALLETKQRKNGASADMPGSRRCLGAGTPHRIPAPPAYLHGDAIADSQPLVQPHKCGLERSRYIAWVRAAALQEHLQTDPSR